MIFDIAMAITKFHAGLAKNKIVACLICHFSQCSSSKLQKINEYLHPRSILA